MVCFSFGYGWLWLKLIPNWDAMKPKKLVMFSLQPSNLLGTRVWMDTFLDKGKTNGKGRTFSTCRCVAFQFQTHQPLQVTGLSHPLLVVPEKSFIPPQHRHMAHRTLFSHPTSG
jgi:hypothetical protein